MSWAQSCPNKMIPMLERFQSYIKEHQLVGRNAKLLLAVSGGVDSVVLSHLIHRLGVGFAIAHCNFKLRGKEADADERFVKKLAANYGCEFLVKQFKTEQFAADNRMGIQEAARKLRYQWFHEMCVEHGYDYLVTAHHADDLVETIILNITRGTGIAGLHGILPVRGNVIRPMLFASRKEIEEYALEHELLYREDSSNESIKYARNRVRQKVMPVLKQLNPNVVDTISRHAEIVADIESILDQYCEDFLHRSKLKIKNGDEVIIQVRDLLVSPGARYLLYRILNPFGFNSSMCANVYRALNTRKSGEVFYSATHRVVHDREMLVVQKNDDVSDDREYEVLPEDDGLIMRYGSFEFIKSKIPTGKPWKEPHDLENPDVAYLDADKIQYPLKVRTWIRADRFNPLGMKGKKLLSDFFTDLKVPAYVKNKTYLVLSNNEIIWVAGMRISESYKITRSTKRILKIRLLRLNGITNGF